MRVRNVVEAATRRGGVFLAAAALCPMFVAVGTTDASASIGPRDGVNAILLDPYGGCSVYDGWAKLNATWSQYGAIPLSITTGGDLCAGKFTLGDLEASGANTVILDSTAFSYTLTQNELQALQTYVAEGHTLLGTDTIFQYKTHHYDNGLAPIFGLAEQSTWYKDGLQGISPQYQLAEQDPDAAVLLRDLPNPYVSSLYGVGQKPAHKKWNTKVLAGARYIGLTDDIRNAISVYDASAYTAIYISSEAAYMSTPDDMQFLYNAIIYPNVG